MATLSRKKAKEGQAMNPAPKKPDESTYSGRFAARLRMLREKTGMTGQEFARTIIGEGCDIAERSYYRWESGKAEPPFNALPILAKALGLKSPRLLFPMD